jgi:hypothetical protein
MTRAEKAARAEARLRDRKKTIAKGIAQAQAVQRGEDRKARDKRRYLVGKLVEDAGLLALSDSGLEALLQALGPLLPLPNPHLRLGSLLARAPLAQWAQDAAETDAAVQALMAHNVTLVLVDDHGQPLCGPPAVVDGLADPPGRVTTAC